MQKASFRIQIEKAKSNSYDDNHYTMSTSKMYLAINLFTHTCFYDMVWVKMIYIHIKKVSFFFSFFEYYINFAGLFDAKAIK